MWRDRLNEHLKAKKQRLTDIFRREEHSQSKYIGKLEFIRGLNTFGFRSSKAELGLAFEVIDSEHIGKIDYEQFMNAFRKVSVFN